MSSRNERGGDLTDRELELLLEGLSDDLSFDWVLQYLGLFGYSFNAASVGAGVGQSESASANARCIAQRARRQRVSLHGQTVAMALTLATSTASEWRRFSIAAGVSVVTMPITAMRFLVIGGALLVVGLLPAAFRGSSRSGAASLVGLGLLVGPAIYVGPAVAQ